MSEFAIQGRQIGPQYPTYIVAEISANHNQVFERAVKIIEAAAEAGVDAVKLQTYTADTITIDSDAPPFQIKGTIWEGRTLYDLYSEAYTPWDWQPKLKQVADDLGLHGHERELPGRGAATGPRRGPHPAVGRCRRGGARRRR